MRKFYFNVLLLLIILVGCMDETLTIEEGNQYSWQKYMSEDEYDELEEGMSYMDVVKVAGGSGTKIEENTYEWLDEMILTQAYEIEFQNNKLVTKQIITKQGYSNR